MEEVQGYSERSYRQSYFGACKAFLAIGLLTVSMSGMLTTVQSAMTLHYVVSLPFHGAARIGKYIVAATKVAEEDIRAQGLIPAAFPLHMMLVDDRCSGVFAMKGVLLLGRTINLANATKPDFAAVAVGGHCSSSCRPLANYFGTFNVPFIATGCLTADLSDKTKSQGYPMTTRVLNSWKKFIDPFFDLMGAFAFQRVGLFSIESDLDWLQFKKGLKRMGTDRQMQCPGSRVKTVQADDMITDDLIDASQNGLVELKEKTMVIALLLNDREVLATLLAAKRANMLKDYVYIAFGYSPDAKGEMWSDPDEAKSVQEGLISINSVNPDESKWPAFVRRVSEAVPAVEAEIRSSSPDASAEKPVKQLSVYAGLLYDALMLWAHAVKDSNVLNPASTETTLSDTEKSTIVNFTFKGKFDGVTGPVTIGPTGDRKVKLSVDIVQDGQYVRLLSYNTDAKKYKLARSLEGITWSGGRSKVPVGYPEPCGFESVLCPPGLTEQLGFRVGVAVGAFLLFLILAILVWWFCIYRRSKQLAEISAINAWIVSCDEVLTNLEGKSIANSKRLSSAVRKVTFGGAENKQQTYSYVGFYKDRVVCIKRVDRSSVDRHDPGLFSELKEMRSIKHENVNDFVGVCITAPNVCYLTVYCKHGSLQDIVQDEQFELGTEFKISFAMDIAQGMEYLHESTIGSHGRLNSSNCVIDNKWTCKITDYGMGNFRRKAQPPEINEKYFWNKLWTAPELLRLEDDMLPLYGTPKGDVYSYGIILQELAIRDAPFAKHEVSMSSQDTIEMLKTASDPPFRPMVPETACSAEWMRLMTHCWAEDPDARPSFREVMKTAKLLSGGQAINIVDNMMKKLEKHNEKLEELVAARTAELNVEKKKVELILYNILPTSVAESLMRQGRVIPEAFDLATIYFSDIVGFMKINQSSTPYQVVALLNGIYSIFDSVTDKYDVFKCETIGDVYMVASGLPVRNADRHASEIATMALHLLSSVASFKIPHMPDKILQLRIGLHTGPVVAGVVGQKMPHYCLFGDTVNTASRMQSGGLALRIHSSSTCADLLLSSGEFQLEFRGEREVKGKGIMKTYWVLSKNEFDMPLPDLSLAATLEEHEFK